MTLSPAFPRRRFTGDEVMRMVELRILGENDPFELLGGELIAMTAQGPTHASLVGELREQLERAYGPASRVREEKPLDCGPHDLPEPDLAVVVGAQADYRQRHLIDVPARRVEVYTNPQPSGSYALVTLVKPGETLTPPGTSAIWALDALLP